MIFSEGEDLEEEYNQALATNIVQELVYQRRQKASAAQKPKISKDNRKASASKKVSEKLESAKQIILIGCHGNIKGKLLKNSLISHEVEGKTSKKYVYDINFVFCLLLLLWIYNGKKKENWHWLLC